MQDYQKMYFELAAKVADVIELLAKAQCQGEDDYISGGDAPPIPRADKEAETSPPAPGEDKPEGKQPSAGGESLSNPFGNANAKRRFVGEPPLSDRIGRRREPTILPGDAAAFPFRKGEMGTLRWTEV